MKTCLRSLFIKLYHGHIIYVHNLSNFDGIFLLKVLASFQDCTVKPQLRKGKMINIKVTYNNGNNYVNFRDSLLILPSSLKKLAKSFDVENKGIFPYNFVTNKNLSYVGPVPAFKFFTGITQETYDNYALTFKDNWSMRQETIKYCELDCFVLYHILDRFNTLIFELYSLNIHRFPSLPSLAFGIYRSKYLKDFKVPLIGGSMFHDLRRSYTGGAVDVYKCHGKNLFTYDVNSLYPYVMMAYPVGTIKFFEGDITLTKPWKELFGFFQVEITAPAGLKHPIIQTKLQVGKNGLRTVAPLGTWTDWLFTEEIINAIEKGYTFKVIKGYTFDKANIFEDYINDLYAIKAANHKDDPIYLIAKLLMNSLYGRFGMDNEFENHVIVHNNKLEKYTNKYNVSDWTPLDTQKVLISYIDEEELEQKQLDNYSTTNVSIAIASAITAYARIHMSQFKNSEEYNLYYSDTDSIVIDKPLPDYQVGQYKCYT
jgi:hypothetical protein